MIEANPDFICGSRAQDLAAIYRWGKPSLKYGDKICLMGGYDPHFFVDNSLDDMCAEAKRCIDEAANDGGYV